MSININPIETYVPTIYVNNSEPDLDETNLNHAEQALKRVTDAANAAILALESLDSAKIDAAKIVNNLLATDTSTVLSGPMGKALGDRLTAAENLLTRLNSDLVVGKVGFPPAPAGKQEVSILFPTKMRGVPHIFVSWRDTDNTLSAVNGLVITDSTDSGFKIATNRIDTEYTWWFSFMAIYR